MQLSVCLCLSLTLIVLLLLHTNIHDTFNLFYFYNEKRHLNKWIKQYLMMNTQYMLRCEMRYIYYHTNKSELKCQNKHMNIISIMHTRGYIDRCIKVLSSIKFS